MKKSDILKFIRSAPTPVQKRDIVKAFKVKGSGPRVALKQILRQLREEGAITKKDGGLTTSDGLPGVMVVEVHDIDVDGDVFARPVDWDADKQGQYPRIEVMPGGKGHPALGVGERALARLKRGQDGVYEARVIKKLDTAKGRVIGIVRVYKNGQAWLLPTDKKAKHDFEIPEKDLNGAKDGDLVVGETQPARGARRKKVRVLDTLGRQDDPKAISVISLYEAGLSEDWPPAIKKDTKGLKVPSLGKRQDLRTIPLVTIDGEDARDFDDAVFAEKTDDGYHLIVAIADVAYYVRSGLALDSEARRRGNSTYFPDRVVPMLPEVLSNDLCSLRPHEDRACLAVHMWIDGAGNLTRHKFVRGLMRSHARLTYKQVQAMRDGQADAGDLVDRVSCLYDAFLVLEAERKNRGALDLDLPERQILIDDDGHMTGVKMRERLDSHKLIEEFMVLANVAAARALEAKKAPCVYRVHEPPGLDKLDSARDFVESFGLSLPKGQSPKPKQLNMLLHKASETPYSHLISEVILRCQSQAVYSDDNKGHYGLALPKYAHFTSPIRRYADLIVHRSLIMAYGLGEGGLADYETAELSQICDHISSTERASMGAERRAVDRFTAVYLSEKVGAEFNGRITGVTRFGLFVMMSDNGADGLVPIESLPGNDYYVHDEKAHALVGRKTGIVFRLGADVTVRLKESNGLTGSVRLELSGHKKGADIPGMKPVRLSSVRGGRRGDKRSSQYKKKRTTPKHKRKAYRNKPPKGR